MIEGEDQEDGKRSVKWSKSSNLFLDSGCTIVTKGIIHVQKSKFHKSSAGLQHTLVHDVQWLLASFFQSRSVGLGASNQ